VTKLKPIRNQRSEAFDVAWRHYSWDVQWGEKSLVEMVRQAKNRKGYRCLVHEAAYARTSGMANWWFLGYGVTDATSVRSKVSGFRKILSTTRRPQFYLQRN